MTPNQFEEFCGVDPWDDEDDNSEDSEDWVTPDPIVVHENVARCEVCGWLGARHAYKQHAYRHDPEYEPPPQSRPPADRS